MVAERVDATSLVGALWRPGGWRHARDPLDYRHRAAHEAGHAIYASLTFGSEAIERVSLGTSVEAATSTLTSIKITELVADPERVPDLIGMSFAGAAAEQLLLGNEDEAASTDDMARALRLALHVSTDGLRFAGRNATSDPEPLTDVQMLRVARRLARGEELARAALGSNADGLELFAGHLLAAPRRRLSGHALARVIEEVLPRLT